jgi:alpha-D-ribose 1-methylphosphonate 5-triphosphate synthase subunit PhnH
MADYRKANPTQKVFRTVVEGMSHPGRAYPMPTIEEDVPWSDNLLAIAHTLFDHEVGFAVIESTAQDQTTDGVYEATKASVVDLPEADYIIVEGSKSGGRIRSANRGEAAFPDKGATIIYRLDSTNSGSNALDDEIILTGPGINGQTSPEMNGLDRDEVALIREINSDYPLGVDCIFLNRENQMMCLPRSTRIAFHRI